MNDTAQQHLLFPLPDSGDIATDVWLLILRNNAKMMNKFLHDCPEIAPRQKISYSRIRALTYLAQAQGKPVSIKDLAEELGTTSGGVSQLVDSLEKEDWIVRKESREDRRLAILSLSESAEKRLAVLTEYMRGRMEKAMTEIPEQDREIMARSLRTLLKSLYEDE